MKANIIRIVLILVVGLAGSVSPTRAQAYGTAFSTILILQNPTNAPTTQFQVIYYPSPEVTSPIVILRPNLAGGKSTTLFIGTLNLAALGFHGTTYIQSQPHLVAIQKQTPRSNEVVAQPITNLPLYGSPTVFIPSVLRNQFYAHTIFTLQNIDSQDNLIQLDIYGQNSNRVYATAFTLKPGESYVFDAGKPQDNPLPDVFNGSAIATAIRLDQKTPGKIVSSVLELDSVHLSAKSFIGEDHGSIEIFMPSAACNFDIGGEVYMNSAYAIQNNSLNSPTIVMVTYSNGITQTQTIAPGSKGSFLACQAKGMVSNFTGSARIRSSAAPVTAVGKVYGGGLSTAFLGAATESGTKNLALPYIRWADENQWMDGSQQRTFIAIQNVGKETITGTIRVFYFPCKGGIAVHEIALGTTGLASGGKVTSKPADIIPGNFGNCGTGPQTGGAAIIAGPENSHLAAVVRVQQWDPAHGCLAGDDYNGINAP